MKEKPDDERSFEPKPEHLGKAGLAFVAALGAAEPAKAAELGPKTQPSTTMVLKSVPAPHVLVSQRERLPTAEEVARMVRNMQEALSPGGIYFRDFNDLQLTDKRFEEILDRMSTVSAHLMRARAGLIPNADQYLQLYMPESRIQGLKPMDIALTNGHVRACNGVEFSYRGKNYEGTASHCVKGSIQESLYEQDKLRDIAVKKIGKRDEAKLFQLSDDMTDDAVNGHVAVVQSRNRFGIEDEYHTFVIKMTEPVLRIMQRRMNYNALAAARMRNQFWYVMPPVEGEPAPGSSNPRDVNFLSRSGGPPVVLLPDGRRMILSPFAHGTSHDRVCRLETQGTCITLAFGAGPNALRSLTRQLAEKENPPADQEWPKSVFPQ